MLEIVSVLIRLNGFYYYCHTAIYTYNKNTTGKTLLDTNQVRTKNMHISLYALQKVSND